MYDRNFIIEELQLIEETLLHILDRTQNITSVNDFMSSSWGVDMLDVACVRLQAIGETVKMIDSHSKGQILSQYPTIPWKKIMGMRDIIAHHYFDVDVEVIFNIVKNDINPLLNIIRQMQHDIRTPQ